MSLPILAALHEAFDQVLLQLLASRRLAELTVSQVIGVEGLDSGDAAHLALLDRKDLGVTFTKVINDRGQRL